MAERPLLELPTPIRKPHRPRGFPTAENVKPPQPKDQVRRLSGPFDQISRVVSDPRLLADLKSDPSAIVPERALVFEIATSTRDLQQALERVPELEFLGEDADEFDGEENFFKIDTHGNLTNKPVPRQIFFTLPSLKALKQIEKLWRAYKRGDKLTILWKTVFNQLSAVRTWGPEDRLTVRTIEHWKNQLLDSPSRPILVEVEFWYRETDALQDMAYQRLEKEVLRLDVNGKMVKRVIIPEIRYHSALIEIPSESLKQILDHPKARLTLLDEVMTLNVKSMVSAPHGDNEEAAECAAPDDGVTYRATPIAALIDGVPMAGHEFLKDRLIFDDPDNFSERYGGAEQQRHGTSMASIILHGDLNDPTPLGKSARRLYVRPITQPDTTQDEQVTKELIPMDESAIDIIRRSFIRMFEGDDGEDPVAPTVRIVNISLGDKARPFGSLLSPWAKLMDHLAWKYSVLIIISAGNIVDPMHLKDIDNWSNISSMLPTNLEDLILGTILQNRAGRRLLAPSESINCLTVGASHSDYLKDRRLGVWTIDPYLSPHLPNPSSAQGLGYRKAVKPEILMPGGREHIMATSNTAPIWIKPSSGPSRLCGIAAAAPVGSSGSQSSTRNVSGTSAAAALATHGALRILDALEDLQFENRNGEQMKNYVDVILKTLLVHSAKWDSNVADVIKKISMDWGARSGIHQRDDVSRLLGFGLADIDRVIDCARERATLIGWNSIGKNEIDEFRIPIPREIEDTPGFRAVTVTVAWVSPLNMRKRMYRDARLEVKSGGDKGLSLDVQNAKRQPAHHILGSGSVYHRRWDGHKAASFTDEDDGDIVLNVLCKSPTGDLEEPVRYGISVSLEVGEHVDIPVYESVRERIRQRTPDRSLG